MKTLHAKIEAPTLLIIATFGLYIKYDAVSKWSTHALETYKIVNHDLVIANNLKQSYPSDKEFNCLKTRPVTYFYYEPGLGLRYFIGGDLSKDYDFWSDEV